MTIAVHQGMSLAEAQDALIERIRAGATEVCPLCSQTTKVYKRKLSSGIAAALLMLYRAGGTEFQHLPSVVSRDMEPTKLAYWGLIEEDDRTRDDGGRAGFWRVTLEGVIFAMGTGQVQQYAVVYNGHLLRHEGPPITIHDALGATFNYAELMAA